MGHRTREEPNSKYASRKVGRQGERTCKERVATRVVFFAWILPHSRCDFVGMVRKAAVASFRPAMELAACATNAIAIR
jgi:hypothetical protein